MTILGSNFFISGGVSVGVVGGSPSGGVTCTGVILVNITTLTCSLNGATAGGSGYKFNVSANGGVGVAGGATLGFAAGPPTVTALTYSGCGGNSTVLTGCPIGGVTPLTLTGTNFIGNATSVTVSLGSPSGVTCTGVILLSATSLTCTLNGESAGGSGYHFAVSANGGVGVVGAPTLAFAATPTVNTLIQSSCIGSGGATLIDCSIATGGLLTIIGSGFAGSLSVNVSTGSPSGVTCTSAILLNATLMTVHFEWCYCWW